MDPKQTLRVSDVTSTPRFSIAGHGHLTAPLCPDRSSSTEKRENFCRAPSKLTREDKNGCPRQLRIRARRTENDPNSAHHSFVGSLRLFWV